jgi:PPOX class probable F420-dependent enzyme
MTRTQTEYAQFLRHNNRAILITRRADGGLQSSPVRVLVDAADRIVLSTCAGRAKARNLRRDSRAALCVIADNWFGPWIQLEGMAEVIGLPEAMPLLEDFYRLREGKEHEDWEAYRDTMRAEDRVLVRIVPSRVTPAPH